MATYEIVKIPTSLGVSQTVEFPSIDDLRDWALTNVEGSSRWIIKENSVNIGELFVVVCYQYIPSMDDYYLQVFNDLCNRHGWFKTRAEAKADCMRHQAEADKLLDVAYKRLKALQKELGFGIDYDYSGDGYCISGEDLFISVEVKGYTFRRSISD